MDQQYRAFVDGLDAWLAGELPANIRGFCFNLYENTDNSYGIELIGSDVSVDEDEDWACSDYFTTEGCFCNIERTEELRDWEHGLRFMVALVQKYMENGTYASILKNAEVVAVGFVDGDLELIEQK